MFGFQPYFSPREVFTRVSDGIAPLDLKDDQLEIGTSPLPQLSQQLRHLLR